MSEQREKQRLRKRTTIAHEVTGEGCAPDLEIESWSSTGLFFLFFLFMQTDAGLSRATIMTLPATAKPAGTSSRGCFWKGNFAALLMATINSAVRAYLLESVAI